MTNYGEKMASNQSNIQLLDPFNRLEWIRENAKFLLNPNLKGRLKLLLKMPEEGFRMSLSAMIRDGRGRTKGNRLSKLRMEM
jgi:hypothetical protein